MKRHLIFMLDALKHDVKFFLGDNGKLRVDAPTRVTINDEEMLLIRNHKDAILNQLQTGFDCVRNGLSIADIKTLTSAAQQGKVISVVRLEA